MNVKDDTLQKYLDMQEEFWKKIQDFYFDNNPLSDALAKSAQADMKYFIEAIEKNPSRMMELQCKWWQGQLQIYQNVMMRSLHENITPVIQPDSGDRRFENPLWNDKPAYDLLTQSYLHLSQTLLGMIDVVEGIPDDIRHRLTFFTRQIINAYSPSNFLFTNPEVIQQTIDERGENIVRGLQVLHEDLTNSGKYLSVRMVNRDAFHVGSDLAYTPGSVIFENDIFQLIQYQACTEQVSKTPLLIVPPFINKFYILDLRESNSMVNWLRQQGHTVFLISWRNPGSEQRDVVFDDLITSGVMEACRVIREVTSEKSVNAIGYCIGGTLLAAAQAWAIAKKIKNPIKSATYMTTLLDFSKPGGLGVFINEMTISAIETLNNQLGYFDGRQLSVTFSLLRENSLYWNYYINNYLKGKEPADFDILYWNSDSTNIPAKIHNFLLRRLYLENSLIEKNKIKIQGLGLNLARIKTPSYVVAAQEDHIALWESCFSSQQYLGGEAQFVLTESGHVAGIINPPTRKKYGYYLNPHAESGTAREWLDGAAYHQESWWLNWQLWVEAYSGEKISARDIGNDQYQAIEPAPGRYVRVNVI